MSMSQDSQDFGSLRRLLTLKRHEQPPPGYFNDFSRQVIARIKAGERGEQGAFEGLFWEASWLQRLWRALETKPIMAGAFGAAVCALLIAGVIYSGQSDDQTLVNGPGTALTAPVQIANVAASDHSVLPKPVVGAFADNNALADSLAPTPSAQGIFELVPRPTAANATLNLTLPGGN